MPLPPDLTSHTPSEPRKVRCGMCEQEFEENCEYVDIGVGYTQCSPNCCDHCGAFEIGHYELDPAAYDFDAHESWARSKKDTEAYVQRRQEGEGRRGPAA